jgi:hypothetical protein
MDFSPVISKELLKKLLEIGFFAVRLGRHVQAQAIFMSLSIINKEMKAPIVGVAFNLMAQQKYDAAVFFLEDFLGASEHAIDQSNTHDHVCVDDEIMVLYGLALKYARKNNQADKVLQGLLMSNDDAVSALARSALSAAL